MRFIRFIMRNSSAYARYSRGAVPIRRNQRIFSRKGTARFRMFR